MRVVVTLQRVEEAPYFRAAVALEHGAVTNAAASSHEAHFEPFQLIEEFTDDAALFASRGTPAHRSPIFTRTCASISAKSRRRVVGSVSGWSARRWLSRGAPPAPPTLSLVARREPQCLQIRTYFTARGSSTPDGSLAPNEGRVTGVVLRGLSRRRMALRRSAPNTQTLAEKGRSRTFH